MSAYTYIHTSAHVSMYVENICLYINPYVQHICIRVCIWRLVLAAAAIYSSGPYLPLSSYSL